MIQIMLSISVIFFGVAIVLLLYRAISGPSVMDRVLALDTMGINILSIIAIVSVMFKTTSFFEAILIIGILAFIGTVAFSKYIERGAAIELKRDR